MTKFKGTPGEWKLRTHHSLPAFVEAPKAPDMPYALDVCGDDYTGYGGEEMRRINMQAISAVPELIEALETTRGNILSLGPAGALDEVPMPYREWLAVVDAALAKALGEQS